MSQFFNSRTCLVVLLSCILMACSATTGRIEYVTAQGVYNTACETEYSGQPEVDKYAVEYVLSYCARQTVAQGHRLVDESLLENSLKVPQAPAGQVWTFELAQDLHQQGKLTDKQFGYLVAHIDLGHAKAKK